MNMCPECAAEGEETPAKIKGLCRRHYLRAYHKTEAGKAANKRYDQSEKGKAAKKRYQQTEKFKEAAKKSAKKYRASEKGQISVKRAHAKDPSRLTPMQVVLEKDSEDGQVR